MAADELPPVARTSEQFRAAATESALHLPAHTARLQDRELAASVLEWLLTHRNAAAARAALDALQDRLSRHLRGLYADGPA
ncbi:hypothetical protein GCM10017776_51370 [Streptomyces griseoluteus]|nr:hypothetical protein GCM10017776_51370 [Streptomyces griseoluteus]